MKTSSETLKTISEVLSRCSIMGFLLLFWWWGAVSLGGDFVYRAHLMFAPAMSEAQFELIHYVGIMATKLVIMLLFLIPLVSIRLVLKKRRIQSDSLPITPAP